MSSKVSAARRKKSNKFAAANRARAGSEAVDLLAHQPVSTGMGLLTQLNMVVLLGYGGWLVIHGRAALGGRTVRVRQFAAAVRQPGQPGHQHRQQHPNQPDRRTARVRSARRAAGSRQPAEPSPAGENPRCRAVRGRRVRLPTGNDRFSMASISTSGPGNAWRLSAPPAPARARC